VAQRKFDKSGSYQVRLTVNDGQVQNQTVVSFKVAKEQKEEPTTGFGAALAATGAVLAAMAAVRARGRRR